MDSELRNQIAANSAVTSLAAPVRHCDQEQITWPDFQAQLRNPHMQQLFAALDVDESCLPCMRRRA